MCRMVIFSGNCIRCGQYYTVPELEQSVSCLEAKNNGGFGDCRRGVNMDQHDPALECASCSYAMSLTDDQQPYSDDMLIAASSSGGSTTNPGTNSSSSSKGSHHHSRHDTTSKRRKVR
ncbi:hypothetical protein J7T55_006083 [Diaporthe amygdali]|uniref:uncharacterized protein n=1 Tax=Phomopsis amygdali TaxID=1214568 RepID=UPI0022FED9DE|nr:uncharacterized protein J7T55_006083 [Diaporthe amygdali]KAJ0124742.1 hypothetical protein J7T55_006083 [Diaporthe amygdali]